MYVLLIGIRIVDELLSQAAFYSKHPNCGNSLQVMEICNELYHILYMYMFFSSRLLLADLDTAMQDLDKACSEPLFHSNSDVPNNSFEAQIAAIFDFTVLSYISKDSKPIIGVSELTCCSTLLLKSF